MGDLVLPPAVPADLETHRTAVPIDHPNLSVTRGKLEYPLSDVYWIYLVGIGKVVQLDVGWITMMTADTFADHAFEAPYFFHTDVDWGLQSGRYDPATEDRYWNRFRAPASTADHQLVKTLAGVYTLLGSEAVDLAAPHYAMWKLSCLGTSIESFRVQMGVSDIAATDADIAEGYWNLMMRGDAADPSRVVGVKSVSPGSSPPEVLAYLEVPLVGAGTKEDPFRVAVPERLVEDPELGWRNLLSVTHSAHIPVDRATGKPLYDTAVVRVFEQPDRDPALLPIEECIEEWLAMASSPEVRMLTRDEAVEMVLERDAKLHRFDLVAVAEPTEADIDEYIEWRRTAHGVEMSRGEAERYVRRGKGWG